MATTSVESVRIRDRTIKLGDPITKLRSVLQSGEHVGSDVEKAPPNFPSTYHLRIEGRAISIRLSTNDNSTAEVTKILLDAPEVAAYEQRSLCTPDDLARILSLVTYDGQVGGSQIRMTLTRLPDGVVRGRYFYKKYLKDIELLASFGTDGRSITLVEHDSEGKPAATFLGRFQPTDPSYRSSNLGCEVFTGVWKAEGSEKEIPFRLQLRFATSGTLDDRYRTGSTEEFERKVQQLKQAVAAGDRETVANFVRYPFHLNREVFTDRAAFLREYSRILSPDVVERFEKAIPKAMFHRFDGVRLDGIWLDHDGKILSL